MKRSNSGTILPRGKEGAGKSGSTPPPRALAATFEGVLPFVVDFLEPVDLLACMCVSKATRPVAGKKLNALQEEPGPTSIQQSMLDGWLESPDFPFHALLNDEAGTEAQLYRREAIHSLRQRLKQSFVVLKYERTYQSERSQVAVFDPESKLLVAIYNLESSQYYEEHCAINDDSQECRIVLNNSGWWSSPHVGEHPPSGGDPAWKFRSPNLSWELEGGIQFFTGRLFRSNYNIFRAYQGVLSPIEVATVLMHALSSDSRSIHGYVTAVYQRFRGSWLDWEDILDSEEALEDRELQAWLREMWSIEYPSPSAA